MEHALVIISLGDQILKKSVKKQLMGMGFRDIIYADDIYEYHLPAPASTLKQGFNFFKNSAEKIIKAYNLFEDTVSKKIFKQFEK